MRTATREMGGDGQFADQPVGLMMVTQNPSAMPPID